MHQKSRQLEQSLEGWREAPVAERSGEAGRAARGKERSGSDGLLMEQVVARENAMVALKRVLLIGSSPDLCVKAEEAPRLRLGCLGDLLFLEA